MNLSSRSKKQYFIAIAITYITMLVCCAYSSPLFPYYTSGDSSIFMMIGKGMTRGKLCYVDFFDHKGPVLYFIEAIGQLLAGRSGIWLIEATGAAVSVITIMKICKTLRSSSLVPVLTTAIVYLFLFGHGNLTENYSIPLVYICLYLGIRYLNEPEQIDHPPIYALIYGISFGIILFIRVNNAAVICFLVLYIIIRLIRAKRYLNVFLNVLLGVLGVVLVAAPICLFFHMKNALSEMLFCVFTFNFQYAGNNSHVNIFSSLLQFALYMALYSPIIFSVVVFAVFARKEKSALDCGMLLIACGCLLLLMFTNTYEHYFIIGLPVFSVAVARVIPTIPVLKLKSDLVHYLRKNRFIPFLVVIVAVYCGLTAYRTAAPIYKGYLTNISYSRYETVQKCIESIPEDERDSVIGYEIAASWYIDSDITPCYKYYTMQHWFSSPGNDVHEEFLNYISTEHPLWIIANAPDEDSEIAKILESNYRVVTSGDYNYYRYIGG